MRVLVVLFAYACAALIAPLLLILHGTVMEGLSGNSEVSEFLLVFGFFGFIAAIYALPIALPVIIFTELRKRGDWKIFVLAGTVLGSIITVLFTEVPFSWSNFGFSIVILPIVTASVMTYWAVAWKLLPPRAISLWPSRITE